MGNCLETPRHNLRTASISSVPETLANNNSKQHGVSNSKNSPGNEGVASDYGNNKELTRSTSAPNLKKFNLSELKSATRNFCPYFMIGEGGFGKVYRGWIDPQTYAPSKGGVGMTVAVKKSNPDSFQGLEEWQSEVKLLGKFSHPNLVKLLGYCREDNQFLLVYEYMQKGSLESHLFRSGPRPLSWAVRLKIAIQAAQGLTFLHTSEKSVIYRDFKPSNVLLDGDYNAKLSDFGLAKLGPMNGKSHITTRVMGTHGYAAPEYIDTGHLYVKSDVYGFGVVLLEMLTGLRALDTKRPTDKQNLVNWAKPSLSSKTKLKRIMDPRLEGQYPTKAAIKAAELVTRCLEVDPRNRPCMEQVLATLSHIYTIKDKADESKSKNQTTHQNSNNDHPLRCNSKWGGGGHGIATRAHPPSAR